MKNGLIIHLEAETLKNTDYRRVIYTAEGAQLVLMSIEPGVEIGEEIHHLDQFIRIDKGTITAVINDKSTELHDGDAIIVPRGVKHNFINSSTEAVKLYTIYTPPEHKDGLVEHSKADEHEEHFDGVTTE
jgi:mannose-6-phosphate isomerase-like protein (cupin superfamily)